MDRELHENSLVPANGQIVKRGQDIGHAAVNSIADAIAVKDKKKKRSDGESPSPYIYYSTDAEDVDDPSPQA